jgi:primosomal protein N' (replication factor Y)
MNNPPNLVIWFSRRTHPRNVESVNDLFGTPISLAATATTFVRVAVERSLSRRTGEDRASSQSLTYAVPESIAPPGVGQRVVVPLGSGNASVDAFVLDVGGRELLGDAPPKRIKAILRSSSARLPESLVTLARWMSEYYVCPLGMVFATMMPAAVKHGTGLVTRRLLSPVSRHEATEILARIELKPSAHRAWDAISALALDDAIEPRELMVRAGAPNLGPINRLVEAGLLKAIERESVRARAPLWERHRENTGAAGPITMNAAQDRATRGIIDALSSFSTNLLWGVTGSGKTEVYLRAIERVIERKQQALVLVPEISLTPQTAARFLDRFARGEAGASSPSVAVLHSGLSASERHRQWTLAASPACRVVVGARSAIFAPLERLGLIVVDEEHATDYKQDQLPRYHARDVAIKRAQIEGCPIVLGSATPSLESYRSALENRSTLWKLPDRVGAGRLPRVEIVDLIREREKTRHAAPTDSPGDTPQPKSRTLAAIGPTLRGALIRTLCDGGQAILLLNRRGFAHHLCCPSQSCGWVLTCRDCDACLVLHKRFKGETPSAREIVRCHHCLAEQKVPSLCPLCHRRVLVLGTGTQRVEDELAELFHAWPDLGLDPATTIARVDGDTMRSARDYFDVLERFGAGTIKVLLGTQMIAKGLDFPNVRLAGVINADTGLALPDFRSSERTFQLISQVAGRAGRGEHPGLVIVQTVNPREPAIALAAQHDYEKFARRELSIRSRSALPPITRMARIVVRDPDFSKAESRAESLAKLLEHAGGPSCRVLGSAPAPIARIAGQFRFAIEILAPRATELHRALAALADRGLLKSDAHTAVDVDPVALM